MIFLKNSKKKQRNIYHRIVTILAYAGLRISECLNIRKSDICLESKGRKLATGESQDKDGRYRYKYNDYYDYLIGMDSANIKNMQRIAGGDPDGKLHKLMEYAGKGAARDVADPWYTGDFEATYRDVTAGCKGLLECLKKDNKI